MVTLFVFFFAPVGVPSLFAGRQILDASEGVSRKILGDSLRLLSTRRQNLYDSPSFLAPIAKFLTFPMYFLTGRQILDGSWGFQIQAADPCLSTPPVWQRADIKKRRKICWGRKKPPNWTDFGRSTPFFLVLFAGLAFGLFCHWSFWASSSLFSNFFEASLGLPVPGRNCFFFA